MNIGGPAPEAAPSRTRLYSRQGEQPQLPSYCALGLRPQTAPFRLPFPTSPESSVKSLRCQLFLQRRLALSRHRVNICWINE